MPQTRETTGLTRSPRSAAVVSINTQPLRGVRDHFSGVVDWVEHKHERVVVTP